MSISKAISVDVPQNTKQTQQALKKTRALKFEGCLYQGAGKSVCAGSHVNGPLISCISNMESGGVNDAPFRTEPLAKTSVSSGYPECLFI